VPTASCTIVGADLAAWSEFSFSPIEANSGGVVGVFPNDPSIHNAKLLMGLEIDIHRGRKQFQAGHDPVGK
jgi:hypothetical protein